MALDPFAPVNTVLTKEQKKSAARLQIAQSLRKAACDLRDAYHQLMRLVYANPSGLTVDEVAATLTQDESVDLRTFAVQVKTLLESVKPDVIDDAPYKVTINGQQAQVTIPTGTLTLPANLFPEYGG